MAAKLGFFARLLSKSVKGKVYRPFAETQTDEIEGIDWDDVIRFIDELETQRVLEGKGDSVNKVNSKAAKPVDVSKKDKKSSAVTKKKASPKLVKAISGDGKKKSDKDADSKVDKPSADVDVVKKGLAINADGDNVVEEGEKAPAAVSSGRRSSWAAFKAAFKVSTDETKKEDDINKSQDAVDDEKNNKDTENELEVKATDEKTATDNAPVAPPRKARKWSLLREVVLTNQIQENGLKPAAKIDEETNQPSKQANGTLKSSDTSDSKVEFSCQTDITMSYLNEYEEHIAKKMSPSEENHMEQNSENINESETSANDEKSSAIKDPDKVIKDKLESVDNLRPKSKPKKDHLGDDKKHTELENHVKKSAPGEISKKVTSLSKQRSAEERPVYTKPKRPDRNASVGSILDDTNTSRQTRMNGATKPTIDRSKDKAGVTSAVTTTPPAKPERKESLAKKGEPISRKTKQRSVTAEEAPKGNATTKGRNLKKQVSDPIKLSTPVSSKLASTRTGSQSVEKSKPETNSKSSSSLKPTSESNMSKSAGAKTKKATEKSKVKTETISKISKQSKPKPSNNRDATKEENRDLKADKVDAVVEEANPATYDFYLNCEMTLDHIRQEFSMETNDDDNDIDKDIRSSDVEDHVAEKTNTEFDGDSFDKKSNAILPSENEEERLQFDHDSLNSTTENVNQDNLNSNVVEKENSTIEEGPVERFDQDSLDAENRPISQEKNCNSRLYVDQKQEMLTLSKRCSIVSDIPLRKRRRKSDIICGKDGTTVGTIENAQESNLDFLKQLVDTPDSKEETEHIGTKTNGKDAPQNRGKSSNIRNRPAGKQVAPKQVNTTNKTTKDKINKDTKAKVVAKSKTSMKNDKDTSKIHDSSPKEDTPPKVIRRRQDSSTGVIPPPVPSKTLKPSSNKRADTTKVQARKSSMDVVRATKPAPIRRAQSHDPQRADKTPIQKTNTASADKANDSRPVPRHKDKPSSAPAPTKRLQPVNKRSAAPKPVLKRSSISLDNRSTPWAKADFVPIRKDKKYVENHKVEWKSDARVNSLQNVGYKPKREEKKFVVHHRLKWNAVSKVAALMKHTQKKRQLAENGGSIETPSDDQKSTTSKQDQNRSAPKNGKGNRPHGRKGSNATKDSNDVAVTEDIGQAIDDTKTEQSIDKKDSETGSAAVTPVDTSTKDAISSNTGNINDNVDQERNEIITTDTETTADAADEQVNFEDSGREQSVTEHPDDDLADKIQQHE